MATRKMKIALLDQARDQFCGMGTRTVKLRLNKLVKAGDKIAAALRMALELEDKNITAKKYHGGSIGGYTYDQINYLRKQELIESLVRQCRDLGWSFGIHKQDSGSTTHIIYFDIPNAGQISYHYTPPEAHDLPEYAGQWDGNDNSGLVKLEQAIAQLIGGAGMMERAADRIVQVASDVEQKRFDAYNRLSLAETLICDDWDRFVTAHRRWQPNSPEYLAFEAEAAKKIAHLNIPVLRVVNALESIRYRLADEFYK